MIVLVLSLNSGLLHVGDIIKEVNGRDMSGNPDELQEYLVRKKCFFILHFTVDILYNYIFLTFGC